MATLQHGYTSTWLHFNMATLQHGYIKRPLHLHTTRSLYGHRLPSLLASSMQPSKKQKVSESVAPVVGLHAPPNRSNSIGRIRATLSDLNERSTVVSTASKRPQLHPRDKLTVLEWHHAHGRNQKATAAHFQQQLQYNKLNQGTVSRWLAAEEKIRELAANASRSKDGTVQSYRRNVATREKSLKHPELEKCLTLWLDQLGAVQSSQLTGKEVKATARQIYDELEVAKADRLELSNGWLGRFQKRHGLKLHRRHSENLEVNGVDIEEERKRVQKEITAFLDESGGTHSLDDVWTMEMTTVLLECNPMKVAHVGSGDRKRITVGLAVNASGTERLEPIFVGCEHVHQTNFQYYFKNRIACMTPGIFSEFLRAWNEKLVENNRHVLLLVNQSWVRLRDDMNFSNVQLRSFPASVEDHLQPFRLGLTKVFHTQFLKLVAHRALSKLRGSQNKIADSNTILQLGGVDAMELAKAAWQLTASGLKLATCCWRKAQILPAAANAAEVSALIEADAYVSMTTNEELIKLDQALQVLVLEASSRQLSWSCTSAEECVDHSLNAAKSSNLSIHELVQLVVHHDNLQEPLQSTEDHVLTQDSNVTHETASAVQRQTTSNLPSVHPTQSNLSPEVVLHAQLTLEQYWAQNHFLLPPSVLQLLQQTRSQLQQTPPSS